MHTINHNLESLYYPESQTEIRNAREWFAAKSYSFIKE
jgi:hypothetical protein